MFKKKTMAFAMSIIGVALMGSAVAADNYPSKEIYFPVGHVAGSISDKMSRIIADGLEKEFGKKVNLENIPDTGGNYVNQEVADADADGYTLTIANVSTLGSSQSYDHKSRFNALEKFTFVGKFAVSPSIFIVPKNSPHKTYKEAEQFFAKERGKYSYGSSPRGAMPNLLMETLKRESNMSLVTVTYRGTGQAVVDLAANKVDAAFVEKASALPQLKNESVRILAVGSPERLKDYPNVPTFKELGREIVNKEAFFAIVGPKDMPKDVVEKIQKTMEKISKDPQTIKRVEEIGATVSFQKGAELQSYIKAESDFYTEAVRKNNESLK